MRTLVRWVVAVFVDAYNAFTGSDWTVYVPRHRRPVAPDSPSQVTT